MAAQAQQSRLNDFFKNTKITKKKKKNVVFC